MKRLKSTLAAILLVSAGAAALGLGAIVAVAALVIGLMTTAAMRLAVGATAQGPASADIVDAEVVGAT